MRARPRSAGAVSEREFVIMLVELLIEAEGDEGEALAGFLGHNDEA